MSRSNDRKQDAYTAAYDAMLAALERVLRDMDAEFGTMRTTIHYEYVHDAVDRAKDAA
jgi:hypothetical protein